MTHSSEAKFNDLSIESIKQRVAEQFTSADGSVRVKFTEYFNNTYSPDILLTWPNDSEDRAVFLRTNSNPTYLAEDVEILSSERSIVLPLSSSRLTEVDGPQSEAVSALESNASRFNTLVAPVDSIQELGSDQTKNTYAGLITKAVFQGGKGLVRRRKASDIITEISAGFDDASKASPEHIKGAVSTAAEFLDDYRSKSITSFLQAMWIASGAETEFPVDVVALPTLSTAALNFLLELEGLDDPEFWARLSLNVDLSSLVGAGLSGYPANLDRLMTVAARTLRARTCRVVDIEKKESEASSRNWFLRKGLLGLHLSKTSVVFSNLRINDIPLEGIQETIDVESVISRARAADVSVRSLSISTNETRVAYETTSDSNIAGDKRLSDIGTSLGSAAEVVAASVAISGSTRKVTCNFPTSTAHGHGNAKFDLGELALCAVPILTDISESELEVLHANFDTPPEANAEITMSAEDSSTPFLEA